MLHQIQPNTFISLSSQKPFSSSVSSSSLKEMECLNGALKGGFWPETAPFGEEQHGVGGVNGGVNGDDLFVDELLDFSNGFSETEEPQEKELERETETETATICCPVSVSVSVKKETVVEFDNSVALAGKHEFVSLPESELSVPGEDLENLEWLSHFVDDSFSDYSLTGKLPPKPSVNRSEPVVLVKERSCFTTPVQTKARSKRARSGVRVWPVLSSPSSGATSSASSTSSITSFSQGQTGESFLGKPVAKKRKSADGGGGGMAAQPRRCSHCGVTKTPQWRAGPLGSKTLCNACGVRFKSGRLLPEYRPACSPTFSSELHSNNHRKVLEMRRKKETEIGGATGLPQPVQSF